MNKKEIAEWIKTVVMVKRSNSGMFIEGFVFTPQDFKKLIQLLNDEPEKPRSLTPFL